MVRHRGLNLLIRLCRIGVKISQLNCVGLNGSGRPSGNPTQNAYIERFNGTFRREVLDAHIFTSTRQVRRVVDEWLVEYNTERPQQALKFMTPVEYRQAA
ncbi:integrase core domain-containing protein [Spirosoma radiotolerans]|uniref:integrase core domain-containing protein n=1 Tax=Spirosoma radiotolerans TaxID=1379870 RepID=UPI0009E3B18D